jgi:hypothetical protein
MKQLNTLPVEDFLEKTRIAVKTKQKTVVLTIKEAVDLQNSLSIIMTRLASESVVKPSQQPEKIEVKVDGGKF